MAEEVDDRPSASVVLGDIPRVPVPAGPELEHVEELVLVVARALATLVSDDPLVIPALTEGQDAVLEEGVLEVDRGPLSQPGVAAAGRGLAQDLVHDLVLEDGPAARGVEEARAATAGVEARGPIRRRVGVALELVLSPVVVDRELLAGLHAEDQLGPALVHEEQVIEAEELEVEGLQALGDPGGVLEVSRRAQDEVLGLDDPGVVRALVPLVSVREGQPAVAGRVEDLALGVASGAVDLLPAVVARPLEASLHPLGVEAAQPAAVDLEVAEALVGLVVLGVELEHVLEEVEGQPRLTGRVRLDDGRQRLVDGLLDHVLELLLVGLGQAPQLLLVDLVLDPIEAVLEARSRDGVASSLDAAREHVAEVLLDRVRGEGLLLHPGQEAAEALDDHPHPLVAELSHGLTSQAPPGAGLLAPAVLAAPGASRQPKQATELGSPSLVAVGGAPAIELTEGVGSRGAEVGPVEVELVVSLEVREELGDLLEHAAVLVEELHDLAAGLEAAARQGLGVLEQRVELGHDRGRVLGLAVLALQVDEALLPGLAPVATAGGAAARARDDAATHDGAALGRLLGAGREGRDDLRSPEEADHGLEPAVARVAARLEGGLGAHEVAALGGVIREANALLVGPRHAEELLEAGQDPGPPLPALGLAERLGEAIAGREDRGVAADAQDRVQVGRADQGRDLVGGLLGIADLRQLVADLGPKVHPAVELGAEDDALAEGEEFTFTESALSIDKLIGKFVHDAGVGD